MRQNLEAGGGDFAVQKKRFTVERMVGILKQAEAGVPVKELVRKEGIPEQAYYRWRK